jgi:ABC-2 type transport system permease protein
MGFGIFAFGTFLLRVEPGVLDRIIDPIWLMAVFVVGPLLSLAAVSVAVMVSSRANDPRVAEQLSMLIVLPLLGVFFGRIAGLIFLNERIITWMALGLVVIDVGLLYFAVQLFQRETILTRWK